MNDDFLDLLRAFRDAQIRFLVVGPCYVRARCPSRNR